MCAADGEARMRGMAGRLLVLVTSALVLALVPRAIAAEPSSPAEARPDASVDVGPTGFANRRPVLAAACPHACPWGELGDFVRAAMAPLGYDVILCRNCNRSAGPDLVSRRAYPPPLTEGDLRNGTTTRVNAPVDFGLTEAGMLADAYDGRLEFANDGPYRNLRLIAKIEDPTYLLVAVRKSLGIAELGDVARRRLPVTVVTDFLPSSRLVLDRYGLTADALKHWGGALKQGIGADANVKADIIVSSLASPANNVESRFWSSLTQREDYRFLDLPASLVDELARQFGMQRVTAKWGLLRGVDRTIPTVGRSGEVVFGRADMPESAAFTIAKAIDEGRAELRWMVRPYSYDPRTVFRDGDVPLHPGAAAYYRQAGYLN